MELYKQYKAERLLYLHKISIVPNIIKGTIRTL